MLDYGYRSKCCFAPIRIGFRKIKIKSSETKKFTRVAVWVCTKCKKLDCSIVPRDASRSQVKEPESFVEDD